MVDSLDFLRKGGRIGGASHLVGSLLSIKPVLEVRDGVVEVDSKQRTRSRAVQYCASKAVDAGPLKRIALADGQAPTQMRSPTCSGRRRANIRSRSPRSDRSSEATRARDRSGSASCLRGANLIFMQDVQAAGGSGATAHQAAAVRQIAEFADTRRRHGVVREAVR